jgi:hypothetical protein
VEALKDIWYKERSLELKYDSNHLVSLIKRPENCNWKISISE